MGDPAGIRLDAADNAALADLQQRYICTTVDKLSKNYAFICKPLAARLLLQDIDQQDAQQRPVFVAVTEPAQQLWDQLKPQIQQFQCSVGALRFPFYGWIPKLHKDPYQERFISYAAGTVIEPPAKVLAWGLRALMPEVKGIP
ncbi:hypothetical protein WJX72_006540 [[Myrmecia] bisecta]|uniref:Uncharacterized protein n=1 Tax=[Myrmecia] bisecta TaxID=41462 RepID=A0AAW1PP58_9CHLO